MDRWAPPPEVSEAEQRLLKVAGRSRKLFVFLRAHRHELFDAAFQAELEQIYRQSGQGQSPQPPALMSDRCWRLVLATLRDEEDEPAFSQGGLQQFRERLIKHDMDRRLLERTVELVKKTSAFDWKKLPRSLRIGVDSRTLEGAGRVEDTINLLGHAGRKIAECMAAVLNADTDEICQQAGAPLLTTSSTRAGLEIDWNDGEQKAEALNRLCRQLDRLTSWVEKRTTPEAVSEPLTRYIEALAQVKKQDLEPGEAGGVRIRQGVTEDHIDRGTINSSLAQKVAERGGEVVCKPWKGSNVKVGLFGKRDFKINVRDQTITCPAGQVESLREVHAGRFREGPQRLDGRGRSTAEKAAAASNH